MTCVEKVRAWHRLRVAHAKAHRQRRPLMAPLWLVCAGSPKGLLRAMTFTPLEGWPRGFYEGAAQGGLRLVLVRELAIAPQTLLLRLMGAGVVLRRAMAEVEALPDDAEERIIALQYIEGIRFIHARSKERRMDGKQFVAESRAAHKAWTEKVEARAMKKGIEKGIERGLRIAVTAFCEAAGIALDDDRRAWIDRANAAELDARLAALRATRAWT